MRKPTIIEEMPDHTGEKPGVGPEQPGRSREKPEGAGAPLQGSRPLPLRSSPGGSAPWTLILDGHPHSGIEDCSFRASYSRNENAAGESDGSGLGPRARGDRTGRGGRAGAPTGWPRSGCGGRAAVAQEPKTAVWFALAAVVLVGGGRKLSAWWQARKAVARLGEPDVTPAEIEAVAEHGRAGVYELLRIFSSSPRNRRAWPPGARWRDCGSWTNWWPRKSRPS